MKKVFGGIFLSLLWLWGDPAGVLAKEIPIQAAAYCLVDRNTGQFLAGKNEEEKRPIASTTKIVTAVLATEYSTGKEVATVSQHADRTAEYTAGLKEGQELTVEEALKGALMKSYNDAAVVLAEQVAGDEAFFAQLMTKKAFALGAVHTHFQNASGLPDEEHYSTAYDLTLLARYALNNPIVAQIVASPQASFQHPGYLEAMTIYNTNPLLNSYPGADGVKTGTTNAAGKCLVASATREEGAFIAVVLHSADRAGDCRKLLDQAFSMQERELVVTTEKVGQALVHLSEEDTKEVALLPGKNVPIWGDDSEEPEVRYKIMLHEPLKGPVAAGETLGQMQIWLGEHYFTTVDVRAQEEVVQENWLDKGIAWMLERMYRWVIHVW